MVLKVWLYINYDHQIIANSKYNKLNKAIW